MTTEESCPTCRTIYQTRQEASEIVKELNSIETSKGHWRVFRCKKCTHYHIGTLGYLNTQRLPFYPLVEIPFLDWREPHSPAPARTLTATWSPTPAKDLRITRWERTKDWLRRSLDKVGPKYKLSQRGHRHRYHKILDKLGIVRVPVEKFLAETVGQEISDEIDKEILEELNKDNQ